MSLDPALQARVVDIHGVAAGVAGFGADRGIRDHREAVRQPEGADARSRSTLELIDVRPVFVGDEHRQAVVRDLAALRIEARVVGIVRQVGEDGGLGGIVGEAIRAAREVEPVIDGIERRGAAAGLTRMRASPVKVR